MEYDENTRAMFAHLPEMTIKINRHYYRCRSCCHVVAVEGVLESVQTERATEYKVRCVCDGKLELMGRVGRKPGLVFDAERCACDSRCTNASGPSCDCSCKGENHGSHRVVPIEIGAGGVPRLKIESAADCCKRAAEYKAAMEPLRTELRRLFEARPSWRHTPTREEDDLRSAMGRASALRTHKGRLKTIAEVARSYLGRAPTVLGLPIVELKGADNG